MLVELSIKNVALIDYAEITFSPGLNIITGETGAGKSMVIDSINFIMGQRANKDFIRKGCEQAEVTLSVLVENGSNLEIIRNMGITVDEDRMLVLNRVLYVNGKSTSRINGKQVSLTMVKELSVLLVDLHGQHEHQSLLQPQRHIGLLDAFCGPDLIKLKEQLLFTMEQYKELRKRIQLIAGTGTEREEKIAFYEFQVKEIESAALKPGEDEELEERKRVLNEWEKVYNNTTLALQNIAGENPEQMSILDSLAAVNTYMGEIQNYDPILAGVAGEITAVQNKMAEINKTISLYHQKLDVAPGEIEEIEERLHQIYLLKRKYGGSIEDIIKHFENMKQQLDLIMHNEEEVSRLNQKKNALAREITSYCNQISAIRKKVAEQLQQDIEAQLLALGMKDAKLNILVDRKQEFGANGFDKVEFMIAPNIGEDLKPLAKIASGGEMSRIMLAMKVVLADADNIETFIFDEIDTGISGRTAQQVAERMAQLALRRQIISITHLPQIAAMADTHHFIEKKVTEVSTSTIVKTLNEKDSVNELARLLGGVEITKATLAAAAEMKKLAKSKKQKNN